jgi:HAE1 family hydrophobic/amphiphilic exporter-1
VKKNGIMIRGLRAAPREAGSRPPGRIHDASLIAFRPIVMTTLAAVAGAVPIAVGVGADARRAGPLGS